MCIIIFIWSIQWGLSFYLIRCDAFRTDRLSLENHNQKQKKNFSRDNYDSAEIRRRQSFGLL